MSDIYENKEIKINSLFSEFKKEGYTLRDIIDKNNLIKYLNSHSSTGKFDQVILNKLFQVLSLDTSNEINIEDFIGGYLQFEEDIKNNLEELNIKLKEKQKIYDELVEDYKKYKEEKLNSEGLCEDAKIYGEITEVDIKRKLKGIKEIIIKVIFNEKIKEFHFELGKINKIENMKFEFKPTSRKDHFEFIMQGLNNQQNVFDIGKKVFPLIDINTQEEYLAQIIIPEIDDEEKIAAYINAKIILYWSDSKFYEEKVIKAEKTIKKLIMSLNKASDYLKKIREIYGDLINQNLIVDFNNEKITKFKNERKKDYEVVFNNERLVQLEVEFNNTKEIKEKNNQNIYEYKEENKKIETKEKEIQVSTEDLHNVIRNTEEIREYETLNNNNEIVIENKEENKEIQNNNYYNEEEFIRQSIREILNEKSTLPLIRREKVNEVIYDKNVTTLPLIYGGTKISYLKEGESLDIDINNLNENNYLQINEGDIYSQEINQQVNKVQNYNVQVRKIEQSQNYSYLQPEYNQYLNTQNYTFGEYKKTNY